MITVGPVWPVMALDAGVSELVVTPGEETWMMRGSFFNDTKNAMTLDTDTCLAHGRHVGFTYLISGIGRPGRGDRMGRR